MSKFINENLRDNEKVISTYSITKAIYIPGIIITLVAAFIGYKIFSNKSDGITIAFACIFGAAAFIITILPRIIQVNKTVLAITNQRILGNMIFQRQKIIDCELKDVPSIVFTETFFSKTFNCRTINIYSTQATYNVKYISGSDYFKIDFKKAIKENQKLTQ